MIDDLIQAAAAGIVLTANKRLARALRQSFDRCQIEAGRVVWLSPVILSLDAWVMSRWQELDMPGALLTDAQSLRLWEEIIAAESLSAGRDLLHVPQAARRASQAQRLLAAYQADFAAGEADEDQLAFLRWHREWRSRLSTGSWIDRAGVLPAVSAAVAAGRFPVPSAVLLAGFDDLTPAVMQLCAALEKRGCQVDTWREPGFPGTKASVHAAVDMEDEVRTCARWARALLRSSPQKRVGVVAPQLGEYRGLVERIFRAELAPASCLVGETVADPFTFSLGTPLAQEGVVCAALRLLSAGDPLHVDDLGWLLRSPYLDGAHVERLARARADRLLRDRGRNEWRFAALTRNHPEMPRMMTLLGVLRDALNDGRRRLPGEWAEIFADLLQHCGWPGQRGLSSREFQAIEHFRSVLGQLASLDRVAPPIPRNEALAALKRLAAEEIFQTDGGEGNVQALGMLEAAGFTFDALWILGMHEGAFPAPARPNPFLPLSLQSRLHMPHADAAREREFAEKLSHRLFAAAPEVVASWPRQCEGASLRPSPFLARLPAAQLDLAASCDPFQALSSAPCSLESIEDSRALPLPAERPFSGGTNILKDQALCPFRAFAHHRLHARRLETPEIGIDNKVRGNLVHGVLERFWRQVASHERLLELCETEQADLLTTAAEEALQQHERRCRNDVPRRLRAIEKRRLVSVAAGWLDFERRRAPFRVAAIEQFHLAAVGRLLLRTRIDRIDLLSNGHLAVIDYKTGRPTPRQWLDARITEPQLPLYCLDLSDEKVDAVLFAMVRSRARECAFRGVARDPGAWPTLKSKNQEALLAEHELTGFDQVLSHWRRTLPLLGDAFVGGDAAVDPVDTRQACQYCDLVTLCRLVSLEEPGGTEEEGQVDE